MHIATFMQDLAGGGAERVAILLLNALVEKHRVSLVLARRNGPYLDDVDDRITVYDFGGRKTMSSILPLAGWLRSNRPEILMSHLTHVNIAAAIANRLSQSGTAQVAVEHNQMDLNYPRLKSRSVKLAYRSTRFVYPGIASVVNVSDGVASSVRSFSGVAGKNFQTINNPVVTPALLARAQDRPGHRWLRDKQVPVLVGCGRLVEQKDFETLIEAFRIVRTQRASRLIILGEGPLRSDLEMQVSRLGLTDDVALPGFDTNPFAAMAAANVFVLSSRWEGLPTVLIEALATGVNVVSTDCPSGPDEVLADGKYGKLVPMGKPEKLAQAILQTLEDPIESSVLRARAMKYSLENAAANYEKLFAALAPKT